MTFIKHATCDTDVVLRRVKTSPDDQHALNADHALVALWCPTCERRVKERELSRRGPYSAYFDETTKEVAP